MGEAKGPVLPVAQRLSLGLGGVQKLGGGKTVCAGTESGGSTCHRKPLPGPLLGSVPHHLNGAALEAVLYSRQTG